MIDVYLNGGLTSRNWIVRRNELLQWCDLNCIDFYTMDILTTKIRFSFMNETDAIAFKLRWK